MVGLDFVSLPLSPFLRFFSSFLFPYLADVLGRSHPWNVLRRQKLSHIPVGESITRGTFGVVHLRGVSRLVFGMSFVHDLRKYRGLTAIRYNSKLSQAQMETADSSVFAVLSAYSVIRRNRTAEFYHFTVTVRVNKV